MEMGASATTEKQSSLFGDEDEAEADADVARSMLDQLLADSRLYRSTQEYKNLLDFVVRLRNFAPFNAMLLQIQKPGLMYAASARDWRERFERRPKEEARPLLILWPFGPVALVYDVQDTEGKDLPDGVNAFAATGTMTAERMSRFVALLARKNIVSQWVDAGDGKAGAIQVSERPADPKAAVKYKVSINKNHAPAVQFATLAHELGHLCLSHLGPNKLLNIPERPRPLLKDREIEAESVAYLVCNRNGVKPDSETYLSGFVAANTDIDSVDFYQIMRAAGQVENLLGLTAHTKFDRH
jgi:hypothetical protein